MPHRMENLMDDELQEAMEMTKDDLLARRDAGRSAKVSRKPRADIATTAKRAMDAVIERSERPESAFVLHVTAEQSTLRAEDMVALTPVTVGRTAEG